MARLILIADDSPIIQRKAQRILQDAGFEVQTVSNGVAAVKKLPALQPALVLADVSMPGKDGYEVCEFVKTSASLLHVPVLLVGSDLEPYDEQRGERVRADGIIKKPFTPQELIAVVTRVIGPVETPEAAPTQADTVVAPTPLPEAPVEREEGLNLVAMGGPEAQEYPEDAPEPLPEPSLAPSMPFPGFAPGPSREVEESRSQGAEESAHREVEESSSQEFEGLVLAPQLLDLTAPEPLPEPGPIITEPTAEPVKAIAPERTMVGPETSQVVEESTNQEVGESGFQEIEGLVLPPRLLDLTVREGLPEPSPIITEPTPDPVTAISHEPTLASPETSREVEESRSQEVEESISRGAEEPATGALEERRIPSVEESESRTVGESISASQLLDSSSSRRPDSPAPQAPNSSTNQLSDSATTLDPEWVYKVVHKVVTRMAPPVLAPEQLKELARKLTDEITTELGGAPRQPGLFISP